MRLVSVCVIVAVVSSAALAAPKPHALFTDHMVLQRDMPAPVWGTGAEPREKVSVSIAGQTASATADESGVWMVKLAPLPAGGPHELHIATKTSTLTLKDVMVGEVWLCSGQSNMAMRVNAAKDAGQEQAASDHPGIRMFTVAAVGADEPQRDVKGAWTVATPKDVGSFSATAYFFGRELHRQTGLAIGLINSSVGGTPIEAWTSVEAQRAVPELSPIFERWQRVHADWDSGKTQANYAAVVAAWEKRIEALKKAGKPLVDKPKAPVHPAKHTGRPGNLFNGKIAPLIPYAIRGAIWYQGESNANYLAHLYRYQLPTMVRDWRTRWGQGDFPFYWVQLPLIGNPQTEPVHDSAWPMVNDGMLHALTLPRTGMAITTDAGEPRDIHPKDKQTVGQRLARLALHDIYGQTKLVRSGPLFKRLDQRGGAIAVSFDHARGLTTRDGSADVKGFAVAGPDRQWRWARARIGDDDTVLIETEGKPIVAVRYNWASNPVGNLVNAAGLPASAFRTDDWPSKATSR